MLKIDCMELIEYVILESKREEGIMKIISSTLMQKLIV